MQFRVGRPPNPGTIPLTTSASTPTPGKHGGRPLREYSGVADRSEDADAGAAASSARALDRHYAGRDAHAASIWPRRGIDWMACKRH